MNQLAIFLNNPAVTLIVQLAGFISAITTICGVVFWIIKKAMHLRNPWKLKQVEHIALLISSMYIALMLFMPLIYFQILSWTNVVILFIITVIGFEIHIAVDHYFLKEFIEVIGCVLILGGLVSSSLFILFGIISLFHIPDSGTTANIILLIGILILLPLQGLIVIRLSDAAGWFKIK